jgi:hypothetical protein
VTTDDELLDQGATRTGRHRLAAATGITEPQILAWVNQVELLRLDGVRAEHVTLLVAAGVDSASELARRDPHHLAETLAELSRTRAAMRQPPMAAEVATWIEQAQRLSSPIDR